MTPWRKLRDEARVRVPRDSLHLRALEALIAEGECLRVALRVRRDALDAEVCREGERRAPWAGVVT